MTKDEIIMLARKNEALSDPEGIEYFFSQEDLIALVGIAVRAEREACAKLCDEIMQEHDPFDRQAGVARRCLDAIRERREE